MTIICQPTEEQRQELLEMIDHSELLKSESAMKAWCNQFDKTLDKVIALGNTITIDASPDAGDCSEAEAAEWAARLQDAIERTRDGTKHNQG